MLLRKSQKRNSELREVESKIPSVTTCLYQMQSLKLKN